MSLAVSILLHEWRKCLSASIAVTTAISIILIQVGFYLGYAEKAVFILEEAGADLWITSANMRSFDMPATLHKKTSLIPLIHKKVEYAENITREFLPFQQDGMTNYGMALSGDIENPKSHFSHIFGQQVIDQLRLPNAILMEESAAKQLGLNVGDVIDTDKAQLKIVALVPDFLVGALSGMVMSDLTLKKIGRTASDQVSYIAISLKAGADATQVQSEMQNAGLSSEYIVWQRAELIEDTMNYWLSNSKLGSSFWFIAIISCLVGFIIIQQIIRMLILDNITEYATLRALGVSFYTILRTVLEKCLWIALLGIALSLLVLMLSKPVAAYYGFYLAYSVALCFYAFLGSTLLCLLAGFLSFRVLYKSEPANLLR